MLGAIVKSKLRELEVRSAAELARLASVATEDVRAEDGRDLKVSIWHDELSTGEHRIVVQVVDWTRAVGHAAADGFAFDIDGRSRPLTQDELTEFT